MKNEESYRTSKKSKYEVQYITLSEHKQKKDSQ